MAERQSAPQRHPVTGRQGPALRSQGRSGPVHGGSGLRPLLLVALLTAGAVSVPTLQAVLPRQFQPITLADLPEPTLEAAHVVPGLSGRSRADPILEPPPPPVEELEQPRLGAPTPGIVAPTPRKDRATGRSVRGGASWYCEPGRSICHKDYGPGPYAAAGPGLRAALGSGWRGELVTVSSSGKSTQVRLIDWCACPNGRVIDLYGYAFKQLAPLSQGTTTVTVSW